MADDDDNLLGRAQRALGRNSPAEAVRKVRAIVGSRNIPNSEAEAQAALAALLDGRAPTGAQVTALEIVIRLMRPVVVTNGGALGDLPETGNKDLQPEQLKSAWSDFRSRVAPVLGSIGRVEDASGRHVGTGFVVGRNLIATNRHVLAVLTSGGNVLSVGQARICFKQEAQATNAATDYTPIDGVAEIHSRFDVALLSADVAGRPPVGFEPALPQNGRSVCTIGYPGQDEANNPLFLMPFFNGKFGVKSAALGEVLDGTESTDIFHDCSTTRGNSGSPVFALSNAKVVGIHRSGFFMYRNEAVASEILVAMGG